MLTEELSAVPAAPPKKSKKLLLIIGVVVAGIVVGGGAGAYAAGPMLAGAVAPKHAAADAQGDGEAAAAEAEHGGGEHESTGGEHGGGSPLYLVENLVLNPANSGGARFLLVSIAFAVKDEATSKAMTDRDPELRDAIIRYFGAKSVDELNDIVQRDSMKAELRRAVAAKFGSANVRDVYFPQFVIQ